MLTPVGTGVLRYSYPMGDTPAVCLTQDIPPSFRVPTRSHENEREEKKEEKKGKENEKSQKATDNDNNQEQEDLINILLLGCGDLRKILFTIHHDAGRRLDITCCDNERSIIARNILLLTLLIDMDSMDSMSQPPFPLSPIHDLFPIYYHFYVTPHAASLVASQARKLSSDEISSSLQAWHASIYGLGGLRFCDSHSLLRVREIWQCWARFNDDGDGDGNENKNNKAVVNGIKAKFQANLAATREIQTDEGVDNGLVYTAIRSAAPAADVDMPRHLNEIHQRFWKFGRISSFHDTRAAQTDADKKEDTRVNPMFVTPESDGHVSMHWGLDPLLGFPLAEAYVRTEDEPQLWAAAGMDAQIKVLSLAMGKFAHWCQSFQKAWAAAGRRSGVVMRWFVGDAIAFGHSLQGLANTCGIRRNSHWYRSRHGFLSLVLDGEDYNTPGSRTSSYPAPLSFMVIDTSNLTDDLGALNVLVATSPLLENKAAATIYTEMLTRYHGTYKQEADNLLCGPLSTVALLLGDEDDDGAPERRSSHKLYTPASFAAFLKFIKSRVQVDDWTVTIEAVLALIEQELPRQPHGDSEPVADYTPELRAWLHLFGVYKLEWNRWRASDDAAANFLVPRWERLWQLRTWKSIPPVMCVTVVVPRKELPKVGRLEMENLRLGRPSFVECAISKPGRGGHDKSCDGFAAVQVGYGWPQNSNTRVRGPGSIFIVDPTRPPGLEGECHLLVSFMVPTSVLLRDGKTSTVKVQFRRTPSTADYEGGLGPGLTVYETPLHNYDQVVITQYMPKQRGIPTLHEFPRSVPPPDLQARTTIAGSIANSTGRITSLAARIRFTCLVLNSRLANGYTARCRAVSPCAFLITLKGTPTARLCDMNSTVTKLDEPVPLSISMPTQEGWTWESTFTFSFPLLSDVAEAELVTGPVSPANNFIELTVPVIHPEDFRGIATASPSWIYPVVLPLPLPASSPPTPISWSIPYLPCIDKLPVIDLEKIRKSSEPSWDCFRRWLDNYTRIYSDWEHRYMQAPASVQHLLSAGESACLHWKKMVRAMFMLSAGAAKRQITFAVCRKGQMRVEMVLYMSCVRLDMANRCLVLDGAVLVRTAETSGLMDVLEKMFKDGDVLTLASLADAETRMGAVNELDTKPIVCYLQTTPDAIQMWKELLPAYVERCRTWEHDPERCEYLHRAGETGVITPMDVDEEESSVLCSCGNGRLPENNERVPSKVWEMIKRRLVRVAISPPFGCAFVERPYLPEDIATVNNQAPPPPPPPRGPPKAVCRNCKREKRKDGGELDQTCPVCGGMKYCSRSCQRADSKRHKKEECPRGKGKKK
ncbi:hypothetical protein QBC45DRAFT_338063 [Copromyces sp. CBS 386.78]|nr:hypothetical protein QBC45DRAFT_338063 [Copromyces sp. CBS 386.78]